MLYKTLQFDIPGNADSMISSIDISSSETTWIRDSCKWKGTTTHEKHEKMKLHFYNTRMLIFADYAI